ncbi:MAG: hypothetical protein RLZZ142_630 [Verrucomicrobiota bacterium]
MASPARPTPRASYHHGDLQAALLSAAEALIAESGSAHITLRECARRAGVSPAAPAHHFGNLQGLLEAVAALGFEDLAHSMEAADAALPPAARLRAMGEAYVRFALRSPGRFRATFGEKIRPAESANERLRTAADQAFGLLRSEVARLPACMRRPSRVLPQTLLLWSTVHGLATLLLDRRLDHVVSEQNGDSAFETLGRAVLDQLKSLCEEDAVAVGKPRKAPRLRRNSR